MSALAHPKPVKRATEQAKRKKALNLSLSEVRRVVFERDMGCRIPWCGPAALVYELSHIKAKGMGGDHGGRTNTANCICCCRYHHQGPRSLHSGHLKVMALTKAGADGPLAFVYRERVGVLTIGTDERVK